PAGAPGTTYFPRAGRRFRSTTAFGQAESDAPAGRLRADVKPANHRYFVASLRSQPAAHRHEPPLRAAPRAVLPRARVRPKLRLDAPPAGPEAAARACLGMREEEGLRLRADLEARIEAIGAALERVVERAPARLIAERDRLRRVIAELAQDVEVDEERLAREIAYLAERWDISEETVRLRSHMELFRQLLADPGGEPVGKRLGFLVQEMHREANTIGSKANDAA